jgi:hypothetical protein
LSANSNIPQGLLDHPQQPHQHLHHQQSEQPIEQPLKQGPQQQRESEQTMKREGSQEQKQQSSHLASSPKLSSSADTQLPAYGIAQRIKYFRTAPPMRFDMHIRSFDFLLKSHIHDYFFLKLNVSSRLQFQIELIVRDMTSIVSLERLFSREVC